MKQHLNTLYVTAQGAYLGKEGEALVVRTQSELVRTPIHAIGSVVCFGRVGLSPAAMAMCCERDVAISFMSAHGRFLGRIEGSPSGNVMLRREQYRRADNDAASVAVARATVAAKVANTRTVVLRAVREHGGAEAEGLQDAARAMRRDLDILPRPDLSLDTLRGIEGDCARRYFAVLGAMVRAQKEDFPFQGRSRRPPLDRMNALLSFVYTLLEHDARSALLVCGLDPAVGFLHRDRAGRFGLALDLTEEFRAYFADRLVLSLINLRQVQGSGFVFDEVGGVTMTDSTRKTVLVAYQQRKQEPVVHPFLGERTTVGMLPLLQARLLARYLRGDLDAYPAFLCK